MKSQFRGTLDSHLLVQRYQIDGEEKDCLLGEGSYGKVYRAIDTQAA